MTEDEEYYAYIGFRGQVEEHYSNIFVERYNTSETKPVMSVAWIRFFPDDTPLSEIPNILRDLTKVYKLEGILFAIGRSSYIYYSGRLGAFYRTKKHGLTVPTIEDMERLHIPETKIFVRIRDLFLEHKWRGIIYTHGKAKYLKNSGLLGE